MKRYILGFILGVVLIGVGTGLFIVEVFEYDYVDGLPSTITEKTDTFTYTLNNEAIYFGDATIVTSDEIAKGTVKAEVTYYSDATNIKENVSNLYNGRTVNYYTTYKVNSVKYFYNFTIDSLKDKKMYNYELFESIKVKVYVNSADVALVKSTDSVSINEFYIQDETVICPQILEEIARDETSVYYLSCLKSNTVFLMYNSGNKVSVRRALNTGMVTIEELISAGLEVYKEAIK